MSQLNQSSIYLARHGQLDGPYTVDQIDRMRTQGKLDGFSWMWNPQNQSWEPVDPAPKALQDILKPVSASARTGFEIILFNETDAGHVRLLDLNRMGAVVRGGVPALRPGSQISVSVLSVSDDRHVTLKARVKRAEKSTEGWTYSIVWVTPADGFLGATA